MLEMRQNGQIYVYSSVELKKLIADYQHKNSRQQLKILSDYLNSDSSNFYFLSGLRRTGKTTLLLQAINNLDVDKFNKTIFIDFEKDNNLDFNAVHFIVDEFYNLGFKNFIIDEATTVDNFSTDIYNLYDRYYTNNCKFIFAGTNSLTIALTMARKPAFFVEVKTTWIPFGEWNQLLFENKNLDIDEFLQYGGILDYLGVSVKPARIMQDFSSFINNACVDNYIYSSIALNIQNSIAKHVGGKNFDILLPLYEYGILTQAIAKVIQYENHSLARNIINKDFISTDLSEIKINQNDNNGIVAQEIAQNFKHLN